MLSVCFFLYYPDSVFKWINSNLYLCSMCDWSWAQPIMYTWTIRHSWWHPIFYLSCIFFVVTTIVCACICYLSWHSVFCLAIMTVLVGKKCYLDCSWCTGLWWQCRAVPRPIELLLFMMFAGELLLFVFMLKLLREWHSHLLGGICRHWIDGRWCSSSWNRQYL